MTLLNTNTMIVYADYDATSNTVSGSYNGLALQSRNTATLSTTTTPWYLGRRPDGNGAALAYIHEIVHYASKLTTTQRQQVEGYLANKWGLSTALPAPTTSTPYAGAIIPMRPFSPLDIDGLSMWLDATDRDTLTLSGSNVTAWADKSGRGYSLTVPSGGYTSPTYSNGVVTTTGSNALWSTSNFEISGNTPVTLFLVGSITSSADLGPGATLGLAVGDAGNRQSFGVITYQDSTRTFLFAPTTIEPDSYVILTPNISGQRYVLCGFYTGSAVQGTYNGTLMSSQSTTLNLAARPFQIGMRNANTGTSSAGTICECICYTGALSTTQRQQVESYLADKWGLRGSMGGVSHPYRFGPAVVLPNQIPGCSLWLDATDTTTLTLSGSNVTAWRDKTGLTTLSLCNTAPTYVSNQVQFNGSARFQGSYTMTTQTTVFAVYSTTSTTTNEWLLSFNGNEYGTINAPVPVYSGGYADLALGTGGGWPANEFWSTLTPQTGRRMYTVAFNGSNTLVWRNGSPATMAGTPANVTANGTIISVGAAYTGWAPWSGGLSELILFSNTLTTLQRQQVEGYLAWKWGLNTSLASPTTSWLQVKRALSPVFAPNQIPGCSFWLDAADTTTMTLSGSNLSQWRDKSSNAFAGTAVSSPVLQSNSINGLSAVQFNGTSQYITFGNVLNLGTSPVSVFAVTRFTGDAGIVGKTSSRWVSGRWGLYRFASDGGLVWYADASPSGANIVYAEAKVADTATTTRLLQGSWDRSTVSLAQNGTPLSSNTFVNTSNFSNTDSLLVGGYGNGDGTGVRSDFFLNGVIGEVLVYLGALTAGQRQRIEGYLAEKWGLRGSLGGLNHPSRFGPPMILPTQISGCTLWLDAADATTFTLSGSNVTQWRDKSGNGNHATTATGTLARSSNSVVFTGSQAMTTTLSSVMTTQTIFVVASANSNAFMDLLGVNSATMTTGIQYLIGTNYTQRVTRYGGTMIFDVGGTVSQNANFLYGATYTSGGDSVLYLNGSQTRTTSSSPTISGSGATVLIGAYSDGTYGELYVGTMSEIVIYNQVLSTAQRQQVEGYLAWKWGLQANLPTSTHPYKAIKP
jgi:hypothetical protein